MKEMEWKDVKEMLTYAREKGAEAMKKEDMEALTYWNGFNDAAQAFAFAFFPKEYNRWFFKTVLGLEVKEEDENE